jgi:hypothetical protein
MWIRKSIGTKIHKKKQVSSPILKTRHMGMAASDIGLHWCG